MNSTFIIQPTDIDTENASLYIEMKRQGLSYVIMEDGACAGLATFHFTTELSDENTEKETHQLVMDHPVLLQAFKQVYIIYGYPQSVLVPHEFMTGTANEAMLELVFGDTKETVMRTDYIEGHMIHNVYRVPAIIDAALTRYYEKAVFVHLFSILPKIIQDEASYLYCIFDTGQFIVLAQKAGKLQVVQHFSYKTADDVAYQMLNICKSFELDVKETRVHLSGMIDAASPLYAEIFKYFLELYFEPIPEQFTYPEDINNYPVHYFSHLFAVTACV